MNRRAFLATLTAAAAGLALDPEQLLWRPGAKTIFLPSARPTICTSQQLIIGDVFTISGVYAVNPLTLQWTGRLQQFVITFDATAGSDVPITNISPIPARLVGRGLVEPLGLRQWRM